ncbi:MAG: extracellular solute-binding protein [Oscillospiraceae bacterium]
MRKRIIGLLLLCGMLFGVTACSGTENISEPQASIKEKLLSGVESLERSNRLYFENGLTITGMGVNFSGDVTKKTDNFFWKAIEKKTGVNLDIFWEEKDNYITGISTMLLSGINDMPDILNASDFGIMDLADDGAIIALDDYLDLMPNIVAAVGEDRMSYWRQVDGHIYTIPSVINVPGAQTMMVRKDWLDKLGLSEPKTWDEWVNLWRAIRDNDLNGNGDTTDEIPFAAQCGADGERCFIPLLNAFGIKTSGDTQFCLPILQACSRNGLDGVGKAAPKRYQHTDYRIKQRNAHRQPDTAFGSNLLNARSIRSHSEKGSQNTIRALCKGKRGGTAAAGGESYGGKAEIAGNAASGGKRTQQAGFCSSNSQQRVFIGTLH